MSLGKPKFGVIFLSFFRASLLLSFFSSFFAVYFITCAHELRCVTSISLLISSLVTKKRVFRDKNCFLVKINTHKQPEVIKIVEIVYFGMHPRTYLRVWIWLHEMADVLHFVTRQHEKCMRAAADKIEEVGHNLTHGARHELTHFIYICAALQLGTFCYLFLTRQRRLEIAAYMRVINNCGLCEMVTAFLIPTT